MNLILLSVFSRYHRTHGAGQSEPQRCEEASVSCRRGQITSRQRRESSDRPLCLCRTSIANPGFRAPRISRWKTHSDTFTMILGRCSLVEHCLIRLHSELLPIGSFSFHSTKKAEFNPGSNTYPHHYSPRHLTHTVAPGNPIHHHSPPNSHNPPNSHPCPVEACTNVRSSQYRENKGLTCWLFIKWYDNNDGTRDTLHFLFADLMFIQSGLSITDPTHASSTAPHSPSVSSLQLPEWKPHQQAPTSSHSSPPLPA
ncbi:hypothetical protein G7K_2671-t1 [Saitoella complicata NRRL Y-17804]|uniref:Uncharacterized protein n=1 Tax=Saitoella complicata (strain BCRC 22490 / CBS 7301 / JCM 7358 / NBRC 10748 / NRRL Y-17804) TaxID=698492 RepID=A0A0E9NFA7_SAICN|nr:hypothetical protein G7K_2671-t1 [Saitoella complicata NRRL Y-17804]